MYNKNDYSGKGDGYVWRAFFMLAFVVFMLLTGSFLLIKWLIPNFSSIVNWIVPNFWSHIGNIFIVWIFYKLLRFLWYPIYSILGKYSYIILVLTAIYIFMQIS